MGVGDSGNASPDYDWTVAAETRNAYIGYMRYGFEHASAMQEEIAGSTSATAGAGQRAELLLGTGFHA
jgi:hypothetical protein